MATILASALRPVCARRSLDHMQAVRSRWVLGAHAFESVAANDHPNRVMPSHLGLLEDNPYAQGNRPYRLGSYMPGR